MKRNSQVTSRKGKRHLLDGKQYGGKVLLSRVRFRNLLSFGPESAEVALGPLNVLIGPNASGKSNFINGISLLQVLPKDFLTAFRRGGGIMEWLWKGTEELPTGEIDVTVLQPDGLLSYQISFGQSNQRVEIVSEFLKGETTKRRVAWRRSGSTIQIEYKSKSSSEYYSSGGSKLDVQQSALSQFKEPSRHPEATELGRCFSDIRIYREWSLDAHRPPRAPGPTDLPDDFLLEDAANLGLVLSDLLNRRSVKKKLLEYLRLFYERVEDITLKIQGGTVQIFFQERDLPHPVPAARLSDGTLRFLCLLAVLCHPSPPPLICIEGPEVGLHPDVLAKLADLLVEASERAQLIVTTHSDLLVNALGEHPEAILVCERDSSGTVMRRLEPERLRVWLEKYSLGELWRMGEIGGNRW